jgi:hypothetical protein
MSIRSSRETWERSFRPDGWEPGDGVSCEDWANTPPDKRRIPRIRKLPTRANDINDADAPPGVDTFPSALAQSMFQANTGIGRSAIISIQIVYWNFKTEKYPHSRRSSIAFQFGKKRLSPSPK